MSLAPVIFTCQNDNKVVAYIPGFVVFVTQCLDLDWHQCSPLSHQTKNKENPSVSTKVTDIHENLFMMSSTKT